MSILDRICGKKGFADRLAESRLRLFRMAMAWCHDPDLAGDLVQETMAKALKKQSQLRSEKTMDAWLFRILHNNWHDHLRKRRDTEDIDGIELADYRTPEDTQHDREMVRCVRSAINKLSEGQRQVLTLVDLEGFSYAMVAEILDIPTGTVMSRLCRARTALKTILLDNEPELVNVTPLRRIK